MTLTTGQIRGIFQSERERLAALPEYREQREELLAVRLVITGARRRLGSARFDRIHVNKKKRQKKIQRGPVLPGHQLANPRICLSRPLATRENILDTIRHEFAHILDALERGTSDHGPNWQAHARRCGLMEPTRLAPTAGPEIFHSYIRDKIQREGKARVFVCGCRVHERYRALPRGNRYICRKCSGPVRHIWLKNQAGLEDLLRQFPSE